MKSVYILFTNALLMLSAFAGNAQCLEAKYDFTGNARDSSSMGNHATLNGPQLTTDRFGLPNSAYLFDGNNDVILTNHSFDYQDRTVSFWIMPTRLNGINVILNQDSYQLNYGSFGANINGGNLNLSAGGGNNYTDPTVNSGQWMHIVLTRNQDSVRYYQNGMLVHTAASGNTGSVSYANLDLVIGSDRTATRRFFKGKIDDIFIYSCELDSAQVDSLYNIVKTYNPGTNPPCQLEARYDFSGNAQDSSGFNRHISVNGAQLTTDRFGLANGAYEFDGTNDVMLTNHSFDYEYRSVSFWIEPQRLNGVNVILNQDDSQLTYGSFGANVNNGELRLSAGGSNNFIDPNITTGHWIHVVLVRNQDSVKYYQNGNLQLTAAANSAGSSSYPNPNLVIGSDRTATRRFFKGKIDDIFIYSCELDSTQVDSLYNIVKTYNPGTNPPCQLEARYDFSGNAQDSSGFNRHISVNGAQLTTDRFGLANGAYQFDGTNDVMLTNHSFDYEHRSISFWIEPQRLNGINVILNQDSYQLNYGSFGANINGGNLNLSAGGGNNYTDPTVNSGQWMHIVLTRNQDSVRYYQNGVLVHTAASGNTGSVSYANLDLVIGSDRTATRRFFKGKIDDIFIYSCELDSTQVDSLYNIVKTYNPGTNPPCQLEARYDFSGNAQDSSGFNRHISVNGAQLTTDRFGLANGAYEFDGTNDVMLTNHSFDYEHRSVSFWIEPQRLSGINSIMMQDADNSQLNYGSFGANIKNGGELTLSAGGSDNYTQTGTSTSQWYHIALIRNRDSVKYYLNGAKVYQGVANTVGSSSYANPNLVIGSDRRANRKYFQGKIDDIFIYSCELSAQQVDSLYRIQKGSAIPAPCLEAEYKFSGNVRDSSGNGNHASNFGASPTTDRFGNASSAFEFNGVNDVIKTGASFDFEYRTVLFWMMPKSQSVQQQHVMAQDADQLNHGSFEAVVKSTNIEAKAGGSNSEIIKTNFQVNNWYHVGLVRNNDSTFYYVNGRQVAAGLANNNGSSNMPDPNLVFGSDRTSNRNFFNGKLDDIYIFSCQLEEAQIDSIFKIGGTVSLDENPFALGISVFPNPANDEINIHLSQPGNYHYIISNAQGEKLLQGEMGEQAIQLTGLAPGIYFISLKGNNQLTQKFIIR